MKSLLACLLLVALATAAPSSKPRFMRGSDKVVGGTDAKPGEIPFQISIRETKFGKNHHFCGGSIYTEEWIITNARCVEGENFEHPAHLKILAGDIDTTVEEGTEQVVSVIRIIEHEHFNSRTKENDIALIQVSPPLTFGKYVHGVALPKQLQKFDGPGFVSGWGTTSEWGGVPDILQVVSAPFVSHKDCLKYYGDHKLYDHMICAGSTGIDSCGSDAGGPMTCTYRQYTFLCGIVSWGHGCGTYHYPGVYTDVSFYVDWIKTNSGTQE